MSDEILHRTFAAELAADGRTVDCRIVPYGERITHNDGLGGRPEGEPYEEEWVAGAFTHQLRAANRVTANVEHEQGIHGIVGHGLALREELDGLHGSFKIHENGGGPIALELIQAGVLDGVSLEARPKGEPRIVDGVVQRVKADLLAIAFCRFPAFATAKILALREQAVFQEKFPAIEEMDAETVERCRRLGIDLPQRYQAHPDETDTPEASGTSEIGTRQTVPITTSEGKDERNTE